MWARLPRLHSLQDPVHPLRHFFAVRVLHTGCLAILLVLRGRDVHARINVRDRVSVRDEDGRLG